MHTTTIAAESGTASLKQEHVFRLDLSRETGIIPSFLAFARVGRFPAILQRLSENFHAHELMQFSRFKHNYRKASYMLGRWACKLAASEYLGEMEKGRIEISSGTFNQPIVKHHSHDIPEITLAHTRDFAMAIAYQPGHIMGVDLEPLDSSKLFVYERVLTAAELELARSFPFAFAAMCNIMWTVKEALSKAIKCGLMTPFEILEIQTMAQEPDGTFLSHFRNFGQYKCHSWMLPGYGLSIVLPRKTEFILDLSHFFDTQEFPVDPFLAGYGAGQP